MRNSSATSPKHITENTKRPLCYYFTIVAFSSLIFMGGIQAIYTPFEDFMPSLIVIFNSLQQSYGQSHLQCLLDAQQTFRTLNTSWFITFGSALFYHRNKSFDTHDVDTGMFFHDLKSIGVNRLISVFKAHGFKYKSSYGTLENGQELTFRCPSSNRNIDIFTFYQPLPKDPISPSFVWWTAMYGGQECSKKLYHKCRLRFSSIELEEIVTANTSFRIVPIKFLVEHYGENWTIPIHYTYSKSMPFLYNIIDE